MAKEKKLTDSQRRRLGIVAKALNLKLDGDKLADVLKDYLPVGEFDETVTVVMRVRGNRGEDNEGDRFVGVSHNTIMDFTNAMMPGFTNEHWNRAVAASVEFTKAEHEGREVQDTTYKDKHGNEYTLTKAEILKAVQRIEEQSSRLEEQAELLSEAIKTTVPQKGRVEIAFVAVKVREGGETDGMEVLKQTKKDQAANAA